MTNSITHNGVIEAIGNGNAKVRIVQSSACSGCKIASHCSTAESKEKVIDVMYVSDEYKVGDKVIVEASETVGRTAVIFGFAVPLFLIILAAYVCYCQDTSDAVMGVSCISILIPYYIALYLARGYFKKAIVFTIRKDN